MEKKLQEVRFALMTMFEVLEKDIVEMNSRKQANVYARMFYNYYLWKIQKVPHNHIKSYIKGMHHATSIHHCNKMEWFLLYDPPTKETYEYFQSRMKEFDIRNEIIKDKQMQVVQLQAEINDYLKTQNNDKRI